MLVEDYLEGQAGSDEWFAGIIAEAKAACEAVETATLITERPDGTREWDPRVPVEFAEACARIAAWEVHMSWEMVTE